MEMLLTSTSVNKVWNDNKFMDLFGYLAERWYDEGKYEDINEYAIPLEKKLTELLGVDCTKELKMTKRPFGFKISCNYGFKTTTGFCKILPAVVEFKTTAGGRMSWTAKAAA